jgi:hypothetical protein
MQSASPALTAAIPALNPSNLVKAFIAGGLAVLVFQFGLNALLFQMGLSPVKPYPMAPVPPWGVPQTLNAAFWGGLWGVALWLVLRRVWRSPAYWPTAIVLGSLAVSAVLFFVVLPLKGQPPAFGWNPGRVALVLTLHAAFGLGVAVWLRVMMGRKESNNR